MTIRQVGSVLWPKLRVLQVYGANTGVGKTIFSSILCRAFQNRLPNTFYLKPVSTGPLNEADNRHLATLGKKVEANCLFQFDEPVSPHIAVRSSPTPVSDSAVQTAVRDELQSYAGREEDAIAIVETAGGVLSPAPSGSSQADLYRPLRMPVFLVGDHQLGGIGTTISAYESLHIRGYDVNSIALFAEDRYDNHSYLKEYFADRGVHAFSILPPPERHPDVQRDAEAMQSYYEQASELESVVNYTDIFLNAHDKRLSDLQSLPAAAHDTIWHPFLQHTERKPSNITAMDSAYGDFFQTYTMAHQSSPPNESTLTPAFDGSASWWTQGLGHGNPQLALTAAHAAGRYGHVMFASAVHKPALRLAEKIVQSAGNPRLKKVFYTDNGSTGMEVAVKMAVRASAVRNGWDSEKDEIVILGLTNSYHGDTIGTMDCSEPSIFNKKVEWYQGRGHWIDFPQVSMQRGRWVISMPGEADGALGEARTLDTLEQVFDAGQRPGDWDLYVDYCTAIVDRLRQSGKKLGALVMEPIVLGAGGMFLADPLFQKALVHAVRRGPREDEHDWSGMPVVFDEVFTGMYRLGRFSAASFIDVHPDIVVNAKLLTGGLLPLCTTTASDSIYGAFLSKDKTDALLHGHSYTAHAVGCAVGNQSLDTMSKLERSADWEGFKDDWRSKAGSANTWSMWSHDFVSQISHRENVGYVFALGSVLAILVKDPAGSGYASTAAVGLRDKLLAGVQGQEWVIHSRVLGNVLYLMAAMTTEPQTLQGVEEMVLQTL